MAVNIHGLNLLRLCRKHGSLGKTAMLGRQSLHIDPNTLARTLNVRADESFDGPFCEDLLINHFGSSDVNSFDYSRYEGASVQHDMNQPLPVDWHNQYDTVIDLGTLEHVFNIPQAVQNVIDLARPGMGQIVHLSPVSGFVGHGFWQFSPEFFLSVYSNRNGFRDTEIFLIDADSNDAWFRVLPPAPGRRINVRTSRKVYAGVRTVKEMNANLGNVQQSDYVVRWETPVAQPTTERLDKVKKVNPLKRFGWFRRLKRLQKQRHRRLNSSNPLLQKVPLAELI